MSDIMIPQPGAVFGDLTIVHNINFNGQSNPMQMMAMQQQNMMLAAAAVNMQKIAIQQMNAAITQREQIALENKINQMKQLGLNDTEKESLKIAASNNDILNVKNAKVEDVEYTVKDSPEEQNDNNEMPFIKDAKVTQVNKRRLLDFFDEDGYFKNDKYSYDKLYKIPEDVRTLVCFTSVSKDNPLEWRNKFRKAYLSVKKQAFKGVNSIRLNDENKYIVVVEIKNQYHIIYIKNTKQDEFESSFITKEDKDIFSEFVMGIKASFDSWNIVVEPMITENTNKNYNKKDLILSINKDCLFSNGTYTINCNDINKYSISF